jgi:hypothetical protein
LTLANASDPKFVSQSAMCANVIASWLVQAGHVCGHVTLALLALSASAAAGEPGTSEAEFVEVARRLFAWHRANPDDMAVVVPVDPDAVHVPASAVRH